MIDGVRIKELKVNRDERGRLYEILKCDEEFFEQFGQVYITTVNPGYAKGWHYHKLQDDNFSCVSGTLRIGLYDSREGSKTFGESQEVIIPSGSPILVRIPKGIWHGFESAGDTEAVVLNIPTRPYNSKEPDEFRKPFDAKDIPFKWHAKKGG
jgi:dTDP-4-dehydrorhamnose 3,5-epimerase